MGVSNPNIPGNAATATLAADAVELQTASGAAPSYAARAWVNFNGTGTVAIRASGNVSSITDNAAGDYTVNFATALPDANYAAQVSVSALGAGVYGKFANIVGTTAGNTAPSASAIRVTVGYTSGLSDEAHYSVAVFR